MGSTHELEEFRDRLLAHFTGNRAAIASRDVSRYLHGGFTGRWFEHMASSDQPNVFTPADLVAVEMLSVQVPPRAAIWILEDGSNALSDRLSRIPENLPIWEADEQHFALGQELWRLLDLQWPPEQPGRNGLGRTKKSKLLAVKRPAMFPVIDRAVTARLGKVSNYWDAFRFAFAEPEARLIMSSRVVQAGEELTLLRAVDIVLWMAHEHPLADDPPIKP